MRPCIGCGQYDDGPRHVISLPDGTDVFWHMDCHLLSNADCPECKATVESANGKQNDELRAHIESGGAADAVAAVQAEREERVLAEIAARQEQEG